MFDLLVVGGGRIGLFLAYLFKKKGYSVLVLERRKEGKTEKVCSGLVSEHFFDFLEKEKFFIEKVFKKARIWTGKKFFDFKGKAYLLNPKRLEDFFLEKTKKIGVQILFGKEIIKIKEKENFVEAFSDQGEVFRGKILAGCDGAISKVAKLAGFPLQKKILLGVIFYFKKSNDHFEGDFPQLFFSKKFPGFFAWKIPRKEKIEWGVALEPKKFPKERLERFLFEDLKIKENPLEIKSAPIPISPLKKTAKKRVFLCGDSAGQTKPFTGGGLIYGIISAKVASDFIDPRNPNLDLYEKNWRKILGKEIFLGKMIKKSYSLPEVLKKIAIWILEKKKNLDQDRPTSIFKLF